MTLAVDTDELDRRFARYSFVVLVVFALVCAYTGYRQYTAPIAAPRALSTVLIAHENEHGSGVHIGNGFILTAAHVVTDNATMDVTDNLGAKQPGTVLWSNKAYDVALLHINSPKALASVPLNCAIHPAIGDEASAVGNLITLKFIHTWGRIASAVEPHEHWKAAFLADMTIAPGMSGGPVFDKTGNLIGLAVGIAIQPLGLGGFAPYAISYIVPITSACHLMGRV